MEVYDNVLRRAQQSGAGNWDYTQRALDEYRDEYGVPFTLLHAWRILKDAPKWKEVELPRFEKVKQEKFKRYKSSGIVRSTQRGQEMGSFNLNMEAGDEEEEEVHEV